MHRLSHFLRQLLRAGVTLLVIIAVNFALIRMAPGDPVEVLAGEAGAGDQVFMAKMRADYGLDKPLVQQFGTYLGNVLRLDLGYSYRQQRPVLDLIVERLPATLLLTVTAFLASLAIGVLLGALAASRPGSWVDSAATTFSLIFYATPLFWIALMGILVFSVWLDWLPAFGYETVGAAYGGVRRGLDVLGHLVLPAATLGLYFVAVYARMTRAAMIEVATLDFVKTAKAKGVAPGRITRRHILRNALLPVLTLAGMQAGQLIGGAVLTETVFAWPGIGRLMFESLAQRDYNLLLGIFILSSALVLVINILTDMAYSLVDPRIALT